MNGFLEGLAQACAADPIGEKWLLAPSRRIAHQWLDQLALAGRPVVNVRVKTPRSLAVERIAPELADGTLRLASPSARRLLVARAWDDAMKRDGYLGTADRSMRLMTLAEQVVTDLRMAGLTSTDLDPAACERDDKGRELRALLAAYEQALAAQKLIDHADAVRLATGKAPPAGIALLVPDDLRLTRLERDLIDGLGETVTLATDTGDFTGDLRIRHAVGEANEIRQSLRSMLAEGTPLDAVEIVYTVAEPYVPLLFETVQRLLDPDTGDGNANELGVPATFVEGVPARMSRPGRLLAAWLDWIRDDYPQPMLIRILQAGLLRRPANEDTELVTTARLVRLLRGLRVGYQRERYLPAVERHLEALAQRGDEVRPEQHATALGLHRRLDPLMHLTPPHDASPETIVDAAAQLIKDHANQAGALDGLATQHLVEELDGMTEALRELGAAPGFDAWTWLEELPDGLRVGGSGPRPGHLHVSPVRGGGHTGRPATVIVGLDDRRFPGGGRQDPLLLDAERVRVSETLPTATSRLHEHLEDFRSLLTRLRGAATLSYSCADLADGSEMFASPVVLAAWRALTDQPDGDHGELRRWLGPPASFAPVAEDECLDLGEWWLLRGVETPPAENLESLVDGHYPNLARGRAAMAARAGDLFTTFDGLVESPAERLDPRHDDGPVLSATTLQMLGKCPLKYFQNKVLKARPPDEVEVDAERWLTPLDYGTMLHDVLYGFVDGLLPDQWPPQPERDRPAMAAVVEQQLDTWRRRVPPPTEEAYRRRRDELERAAEIFLNEEVRRAGTGRPVFLEASIGMASEDRRTDLDAPDPVAVALPGGGRVRARARIDRIDRLDPPETEGSLFGRPTFLLWDYKAGSYVKPYDPGDVFDHGRLLQHALYMGVATPALRDRFGDNAKVDEFRFLFPGVKTHGRIVRFGANIVPEGLEVIERLCRIIAGGVFIATEDDDDCKWCDYKRACRAVNRDLRDLHAATKRKMRNADNGTLTPFVELRVDA